MPYSLRTLERLERYGQELGFRVCDQSRRRVWDIYTAASEQQRNELLHNAGLLRDNVPSYASIERVFMDGRPVEPCRPFTNRELEAMKSSLVPTRSRTSASSCKSPIAIYVVGLPAAGKGVLLKQILTVLGFSLETMANLDMDHIRSFHGQFNQYLRGTPGAVERQIYKELIPWFNEGSNAEETLYKADNSVVRHLLARQCDFILPVQTIKSFEFIKYEYASSDPFGYVPYLIEVRVPIKVALHRAIIRARVTGRYTPPEYIQEAKERIAELLPVLKEFVESHKGGVVASFDNSRVGGGGLGPVRIQHAESSHG